MPRPLNHGMPEHIPSDEWGEDTPVQWGDSGLVLRSEENGGNYGTAFFEAFPNTGAPFIRGEGETVAEAEADALRQRRKEMGCETHLWCRKGYANGVATCSRCGIMNTRALPGIVRLGAFRDPVNAYKVKSMLGDGYVGLHVFAAEKRGIDLSPSRRTRLQLRRLGIRVPDAGLPVKEDAEACQAAARAWALGLDEAGIEALRDPAVLDGEGCFGERETEDLLKLIGKLQAEAVDLTNPAVH